MKPQIVNDDFLKSKWKKLSKSDKELYCIIEQLFLMEICDDITLQQFIHLVMEQCENKYLYEQSRLRVSETV